MCRFVSEVSALLPSATLCEWAQMLTAAHRPMAWCGSHTLYTLYTLIIFLLNYEKQINKQKTNTHVGEQKTTFSGW